MKDMLKQHRLWALPTIFICALLCTGIFHEYISCAFGVFIILYLWIVIKEEKKLVIYKNVTSIAIGVLIIGYMLSTLWAVDPGMGVIGIFKYLPIAIFLLLLMQDEFKETILKVLPYAVAVITLFTIIGMAIPLTRPLVTVAGRLAGTFQYPNAYALLLLVCEMLLITKEHKKKVDLLIFVVLIAGLLLTGSRTIFVLAVLGNIVLLFKNKSKKLTWIGLGVIATLIVGIGGYTLISGGADAITRLLRISLTESTFVGRILYFVDALPLVLKHPFGLGYMGHYYLQQSIQTGFYSVRYIHNDFMQILLDIGWIPFVLFVIAILKSIVNKKVPFQRKTILIIMCLHIGFDFDLQFLAMFCLLLLFLDFDSGKKIVIRKSLAAYQGILIGVCVICLYFTVALSVEQTGNYRLALRLYPYNTYAATNYLTEIENLEEAVVVADHILKRNPYVTIAESVKAREAYANGDFGNLILYKNSLIEKAPYQYAEYEEYARMLINGVVLYQKSEDEKSAEICRKELVLISSKLKDAEKKLSKLGKMIKDQPITELPEELQTYIKQLGGER